MFADLCVNTFSHGAMERGYSDTVGMLLELEDMFRKVGTKKQ